MRNKKLIEKYFWDNYIIIHDDIKAKIIDEFANQFVYEEVLSYLKVPQIIFGIPRFIPRGERLGLIPREDLTFEYDNKIYIELHDIFFDWNFIKSFYGQWYNVQLLIPERYFN